MKLRAFISSFVTVFLLLSSHRLGAQEKSKGQDSARNLSKQESKVLPERDSTGKETGAYIFPDKETEPEGGTPGLRKFLAQNIKYPKTAIDNNIQGIVMVRVIINEDGSVGNTEIVKGIGGGCDEEALREVKSMPKWKPAELKGRPVKLVVMIPVRFSMR